MNVVHNYKCVPTIWQGFCKAERVPLHIIIEGTLMKCKKCGIELEPNAKFCKACGEKVEIQDDTINNKKYCRFCGKELAENVAFCKYCGKPTKAQKEQFSGDSIVTAPIETTIINEIDNALKKEMDSQFIKQQHEEQQYANSHNMNNENMNQQYVNPQIMPQNMMTPHAPYMMAPNGQQNEEKKSSKGVVIGISVGLAVAVAVAAVVVFAILPNLNKDDKKTTITAGNDRNNFKIESAEIGMDTLSNGEVEQNNEEITIAIRDTEKQTEQATTPEPTTEAPTTEAPTTEKEPIECPYDYEQKVVVQSSGNTATIHMYNYDGNKWSEDTSVKTTGFLGKEGTISPSNMSESHSATPVGLYTIGQAFYIDNKPSTGLSTFQVTNDTYWVDDPNSKYYNKRVEGTKDKDWSSAEHMIDSYGAYKYGFVINYNMSAEYNKGSAIFFHVSSRNTAGCVGTSESMVLEYLRKLNQSNNPYILIL